MAGKNSLKVAPLMKLSLQLTLAADGEGLVQEARPLPMQFIWGIGKQGLVPFESALHGKAVGDRLTMNVEPGGLPALFGHLCFFLPDLRRRCSGACRLAIVLTEIEPADGREVIKALAALAEGCGDGCECGCGC